MVEQKQIMKKKQEFKSFEQACKDAAKEINGRAKELTYKMWEIGKILIEQREKVNPKFKTQFYCGVAERMNENLPVRTLSGCALLYERFPDLGARVQKTGLSVSHYVELGQVQDKEHRKKLETRASKEGWTRDELRKEISPEPMEFERTANDTANDILNDFSSITDDINELINEMNIKDISKAKAERLLTSSGVLIFKTFPRLVKEMIKIGASPDNRILDLMKK